MQPGDNPYTILGITQNATLAEIKKAYYKLAKQYHPDKHPGKEEEFKKINAAYEILSDSDKKKAYDDYKTVHASSSFYPNWEELNKQKEAFEAELAKMKGDADLQLKKIQIEGDYKIKKMKLEGELQTAQSFLDNAKNQKSKYENAFKNEQYDNIKALYAQYKKEADDTIAKETKAINKIKDQLKTLAKEYQQELDKLAQKDKQEPQQSTNQDQAKQEWYCRVLDAETKKKPNEKNIAHSYQSKKSGMPETSLKDIAINVIKIISDLNSSANLKKQATRSSQKYLNQLILEHEALNLKGYIENLLQHFDSSIGKNNYPNEIKNLIETLRSPLACKLFILQTKLGELKEKLKGLAKNLKILKDRLGT